MSKTNDWEKVEPELTPAWNAKKEDGSFSLKEGDELVGIFKGSEDNVGQNNSTIYNFKTKKGDYGVWGSTVLEARLKNIEEGEEVRIVYKGQTKSEKTGRSYHDYDVFHRQPVVDDIPVIEDDNIDTSEIAF